MVAYKQELRNKRNSRCQRTALKQHSFLGNGRETDNGATSIDRQRILNKRDWKAATRERLGKHVLSRNGHYRKMNGVFYVVRADML
jgi:hypothetical protein